MLEHDDNGGCPPQSTAKALPERHTNALHVRLPADMAFAAAGQHLSRFGDVMSLEEVPSHSGSGLTVSVVFFDVRAAELATKTIGTGACERLPQYGHRTVRMSGEFSLDNESVDCVSNVWDDEVELGTYMVEFYDTRDAHRVRQQAQQQVQQQMPNLMPQQAFLHCDAGGQLAAGAPYEEEIGQPAILLRGLPIAVCTPNMLSAMIQQAGLSDHVLQKQVVIGKQCGEVLLTMDSMRTANYCFGHFHGCCWDASGLPVSAEYMVVPGKSCAPADGGSAAKRPSKSSIEFEPDQVVDVTSRQDDVVLERRDDAATEMDVKESQGVCVQQPSDLEIDVLEGRATSDESAAAGAVATKAEGGLHAESAPTRAEVDASAVAAVSAGATPKAGGRPETRRGESGQSLSTCDSEAQLEKDMVRHS